MSSALLGCLVAVFLLVAPQPGHCSAVYIDSTRYVYHVDPNQIGWPLPDPNYPLTYQYYEPAGQHPDEWSDGIGWGGASQSSRIFSGAPYTSPLAPSGIGGVQIIGGLLGPVTEGISYYRAAFSLDAATPYELSGRLDATVVTVLNDLAVRLSGPGGSIFEARLFEYSQGTFYTFLSSGILDPGVYEIEAVADLTVDHGSLDYYGVWQFELSLPEVRAVTLLSVSLIVLFLLQRRATLRPD